jgi:hypothetical protein
MLPTATNNRFWVAEGHDCNTVYVAIPKLFLDEEGGGGTMVCYTVHVTIPKIGLRRRARIYSMVKAICPKRPFQKANFKQ